MIDFTFDDEVNQQLVNTPSISKQLDFDFDEFQPDLSKIKESQLKATDGENVKTLSNLDLLAEWTKQVLNPKIYIGLGMNFAENAKPALDWAVSEDAKLEDFDINSVSKEFGKSALRETSAGTLKIVSNMTFSLGHNLQDEDNEQNFISKNILKFSDSCKNVAEKIKNYEFLKTDDEILAGTFKDNPSWERLANVLGGSSGQVANMFLISKFTSPKVAYGFYAGASGSEMFRESYEKEQNLSKANTLAAISTVSTYALDRIFEPLPLDIDKGMKTTAAKIGHELLLSPVKEGTTETLQGVLAENLVKKIGINPTQDLYEGTIENLVGGFGGGASGAVMAGTAYAAGRRYQEAKDTALEKGATIEEINQFEQSTLEKLVNHPETVDKVLSENFDKAINLIDENLKQVQDKEISRNKPQYSAELKQVYQTVFNNLKGKLGEKVADANAKVVQGMVLFGANETGLSPAEFINQRFPQVENITLKEFNQRVRQSRMSDLDQLKADIAAIKKGYKAKDKRLSLTEYLKKKGGLKDNGGELKAMEANKIVKGLVNDKTGITFDEATRLAWEDGYLISEERPEINLLLDKLSQEFNGKKVFNEVKTDTTAEYLDNLSEAINRSGGNINLDSPEEILIKLKKYEESFNTETSQNLPLSDEDLSAFLGDNINFQLPPAAYDSNGKADIDTWHFKDWFGNSKVVNENGEPLIVYHGSAETIEVFDESHGGENTGNNDYGAFYFSNESFVAQQYSREAYVRKYEGYSREQLIDDFQLSAEEADKIIDDLDYAADEQIKTVEAYLRMENPLIIDFKNENIDLQGMQDLINFAKNGILSETVERYLDYSEMYRYNPDDIEDFRQEIEERARDNYNLSEDADIEPYMFESATDEIMQENNFEPEPVQYDGIIAKNVMDGINDESHYRQDEYIVFDPNQIKSVYNNGYFSPYNDNIYFQADIPAKLRNQRVAVVDLTDKFSKAPTKAEVESYINELMRSGRPIPTKSLEKLIDIKDDGRNISGHIVNGRLAKVLNNVETAQRNIAVASIEDLIKNAVFVEKEVNKKWREKPKVEEYYRFYVPVKLRNKVYTVRIVTEKWKGESKLRPDVSHLYDVIIEKKSPGTSTGKTDLSDYGGGLSIKVSQMLDGVKGFDNELYRQEDMRNRPKGAYTKGLDNQTLISLFERADASTFMHEMAHFFFDEIKEYAKFSPKSAKMLEAINQYLGTENGTYTKEKTELFARGFEQFLRDGKAPSNYLKRAFTAFFEWLRQIYITATELNAAINEEIRAVYDEMVGGRDLDYYLQAPAAEVIGRNFDRFQAKRKDITEMYLAAANKKARTRQQNKIINHDNINNFYEDMRDFFQDSLVPVEDVINQIAPELAVKNRKLEIAKLQNRKNYLNKINPFITKLNAMPPVDFYILDLALKNRDFMVVNELITKYNMSEEFKVVRDLLADLRKQMIEAGIEVGYLEDYFPRRITDAKGLVDYVTERAKRDKNSSFILQALNERRKSGYLSKDDEAQIVNSLIRGFGGKITLANVGTVKSRYIDLIDENLNKYYKTAGDALVEYVSGAAELIENKKYFGRESAEVQELRARIRRRTRTLHEYLDMTAKEAKWKEIKKRNYEIGGIEAQIRNTYDEFGRNLLIERKNKLEENVKFLQERRASYVKQLAIERMTEELKPLKEELEKMAYNTIEESVGAMLLKLVEDGKIDRKQEDRLKDMLVARFSNRGLGNEFLRLIRDGGYIGTLGNLESALTQIGDVGLSAYQNGLWNTAFEYVKAWTGESVITLQDLGLDRVIKETTNMDVSALSQTLDKVLKYAGFEKMDKIAKQTLVNAAVNKARRDAKANKKELSDYLSREFGEQADKVKQDLIKGEITPEIIEYALFKLMDVQPIIIDQMPRFYAEGGKKRMFYMMKSYFIKQLNEYRKIVFETARQNPQKALGDLIRLSAYLLIFNGGADLLKDLIFGRKIKVSDTLVNNIFMGGAIGKYQGNKLKRDGISGVVGDFIMPPIIIDSVITDIANLKNIKDWRAWRDVPLVGRPYYWYFGGGYTKKQKEKKKELNKLRNRARRKRRHYED